MEPHAGIEPAFPAWKAGTLAVVLVRRWCPYEPISAASALPTELESHESGCSDSNAVSPGPRPGGAPHPLHPGGRGGQIRTAGLTVPNRARSQAAPQPVAWRRWESNPLRQRLQGAPAPLAVIPMPGVPASARLAGTPDRAALDCRTRHIPLWSCQVPITFPPKGGDPQGRQDSNLRRAVLEAAVLAAELRPYEIRNRPPGGVLGAVPAWPLTRRLRGHLLPRPVQHRLREGVIRRSLDAG